MWKAQGKSLSKCTFVFLFTIFSVKNNFPIKQVAFYEKTITHSITISSARNIDIRFEKLEDVDV